MDTLRRPFVSTGNATDDARRTVSANYAILASAMAYGDTRTIATSFAPNAEVITPDTTYTGLNAIVNGLARLASTASLAEFQRKSVVTKVVDSTVTDSGTYVVKTRKGGALALVETGRYATVWRMTAPPKDWVITRDHLYRDGAKKAR